MQIGHKIAQLRHQKNVSQKQLAADLHMSSGLVGMWETNKRLPSLENFILLIDYFAVDADLLLEDDRTLRPEQYRYSRLSVPAAYDKLLHTFMQLNEDNQDILIGDSKKMLKNQRLEEKRNTASIGKVN